jgi:hypothetical protein
VDESEAVKPTPGPSLDREGRRPCLALGGYEGRTYEERGRPALAPSGTCRAPTQGTEVFKLLTGPFTLSGRSEEILLHPRILL